MSFSISGKTAIVTGAASGIGLAIARHLADQGANVMCADANEKQLAESLGDVPEDGNVRMFSGDLRQRLTLANLLSATVDAFEEVDILVNSSRHWALTDALDVEDTSVATLLEQNLMTALELTQMVAKRMMKRTAGQPEGQIGSIINLSSIAARLSQPELMGYSIASAAVQQMTRSMALSLAPHRIRVNAISFGSVMSTSLRQSVSENREWREDIRKHTPLGRIAAPNELCSAVQFLAAESSGFMTGEIMVIDGGRSLLGAVSAPAD